jgi:competence protein ComGB
MKGIQLLQTLAPKAAIYLGFVCLCCGVYYICFFMKKSALDKAALIMKAPWIGRIYRLFVTQFFSVQMSFLLDGGLSISDGLYLFEQNRRQVLYASIANQIRTRLQDGMEFDQACGEINMFIPELLVAIKHGQDNSKLPNELYIVSERCIGWIEEKIGSFLKWVQPIMLLGLALVVISIYLSVMLPMFQMLEGV